MAMKRYRVEIRWQHRKYGPRFHKCSAEGTSIRRALNNALLGFFSDRSNRSERRDAHASLTLSCARLQKPTALHDPPTK